MHPASREPSRAGFLPAVQGTSPVTLLHFHGTEYLTSVSLPLAPGRSPSSSWLGDRQARLSSAVSRSSGSYSLVLLWASLSPRPPSLTRAPLLPGRQSWEPGRGATLDPCSCSDHSAAFP